MRCRISKGLKVHDLLSYMPARKMCVYLHLTVSGYYPVNRLVQIQIHGYIHYPDNKNY